MLKKIIFAFCLILFTQAAFANPSFMLGAKTFTLDFKGYSGFMFELGSSTGIPMGNDNLFLGVNSGFGYAGDSYSEQITSNDKIKVDASSIALPIKAFFSYGLFGINIGTLITFWDVKAGGKVSGINMSDFNEKGTKAYFDFGIMIFPTEKFSIGLDVITGKTTGFALGAAYHFGKQSDTNEECHIYDAFIRTEGEKVFICLEFNNQEVSCLDLESKFGLEDISMDVIRNFNINKSGLEWNELPISFSYSEFPTNGVCD